MLQLREKEIFETLKKMNKFEFVIIGGYAVNAYTLPRFSVDCDIVIKDKQELKKIENTLVDLGYLRREDNKDKDSYYENFTRFEKDMGKSIKVSVDILVKEVLDRQTKTTFPADWVFDNSEVRVLRGKTITEELKLRIINLDALFILKFISCRLTDVRDIFMLAPNINNRKWVKEEILKKYNVEVLDKPRTKVRGTLRASKSPKTNHTFQSAIKREGLFDFEKLFLRVKEKITSKQFKDNLQGVYGIIDDKIFEKHKKALLDFG